MISFETTAGRFNYRVAGVAIAAGRVLVHQREGDDFWTLPGGRPEPMEPAGNALRREMTCGELASGLHDFEAFEGDRPMLFRWCPLDTLEALPMRPTFLAPALRDLPKAPEHLVHED